LLPPRTTLGELIERYDGILFDAYGVLVDGQGACSKAAEALSRVRAAKKPFWVVTNDASRLPATNAARLRNFGLDVQSDQILSSGSLIEGHFARLRAAGQREFRCRVLGTNDSEAFVTEAGGQVIPWGHADASITHLILADDAPCTAQRLEEALNLLLASHRAQRPIECILLNPDAIYPKHGSQFGLAAGAYASLLEAAIFARLLSPLQFVRYGKPGPHLFEMAKERAGTDHLVMIGDQIPTDVKGAILAGLDCAITTWGITSLDDLHHASPTPTYRLESW